MGVNAVLSLLLVVVCLSPLAPSATAQCLAHSTGPTRAKGGSLAVAAAKTLNRVRAIRGFPLIETGSGPSTGCAACIAAHEPSADSKEPEPCWFCPSTGECRPLSHALLRPLCPARWRGSAPPARISGADTDLGPVSWKASCSDRDQDPAGSQSLSSGSGSGSGSESSGGWPGSRQAVAAQEAAHLALALRNGTSPSAPHLNVVPMPRSGRAEALDSELLGPADLEGEEDHSRAPPIFDREALAEEMLRASNKSAVESTITALRALNASALLRVQTLWFSGEAWARLAGALSSTGKGSVTPAGLQALMAAASSLYGIPPAAPAAQAKAKAALSKFLQKRSIALLLNSSASPSASASASSTALPHVSADTDRTFPFRLLSELLSLLPDSLFASKNHKGSQLLQHVVLVGTEAVDRAGMVVPGETVDNPKAGTGHGSLVFYSNSWRDERLFSLVALHELGHLWEKSMRRVDPSRHARLVSAAAALKAPKAMPYIWPLPDGTRKGRMAYLFGERTNEPLAEAFCLYVLQGDLLRSHIRETRAQADLKGSKALRAVFTAWDTLYSELKRSLGRRYPDWEWAAYSAARPQPAAPEETSNPKRRRHPTLTLSS